MFQDDISYWPKSDQQNFQQTQQFQIKFIVTGLKLNTNYMTPTGYTQYTGLQVQTSKK